MRDDVFIEIRSYLKLLRRRWAFVAIPAIIVLAITVLRFRMPDPYYTTSMEYLVSQPPTESTLSETQERRWTWVTSQYVVNSITDWANGSSFSLSIAEEVQAKHGVEIDYLTLYENLEADTIRSRLTIFIDHLDETELEYIAEAATVVLARDNGSAVPQVQNIPAEIRPIDNVIVKEIAPGIPDIVMPIAMRIFVAAAAGLGLALLMEYIDPRIYSKQQVTAIDIPFVGSIPRE